MISFRKSTILGLILYMFSISNNQPWGTESMRLMVINISCVNIVVHLIVLFNFYQIHHKLFLTLLRVFLGPFCCYARIL